MKKPTVKTIKPKLKTRIKPNFWRKRSTNGETMVKQINGIVVKLPKNHCGKSKLALMLFKIGGTMVNPVRIFSPIKISKATIKPVIRFEAVFVFKSKSPYMYVFPDSRRIESKIKSLPEYWTGPVINFDVPSYSFIFLAFAALM